MRCVMGSERGNGTPAGVAGEQWVKLVAEQLWAGQTRDEVVQELARRGLDAGEASRLVETVEEELRRRGAL
jgi:hypothetical protein